MPLLDAMLLDPYRINTWIAYRSDGVKGTGTQNDPWDGSTKFAATVSVTALSNVAQEATATATAHGFSNNDVVTIDGVTGNGAAQWNGTFLRRLKMNLKKEPRNTRTTRITNAIRLRFLFPFRIIPLA